MNIAMSKCNALCRELVYQTDGMAIIAQKFIIPIIPSCLCCTVRSHATSLASFQRHHGYCSLLLTLFVPVQRVLQQYAARLVARLPKTAAGGTTGQASTPS